MYKSLPLIFLKDLEDVEKVFYVWYCHGGLGGLLPCWSSPVSRTRMKAIRFEKGLAVPVSCVYACPWVYNAPSPPLSCSSCTNVTHWCGWNLIEKWATVCIVITERSNSRKPVWKNQDAKNCCSPSPHAFGIFSPHSDHLCKVVLGFLL